MLGRVFLLGTRGQHAQVFHAVSVCLLGHGCVIITNCQWWLCILHTWTWQAAWCGDQGPKWSQWREELVRRKCPWDAQDLWDIVNIFHVVGESHVLRGSGGGVCKVDYGEMVIFIMLFCWSVWKWTTCKPWATTLYLGGAKRGYAVGSAGSIGVEVGNSWSGNSNEKVVVPPS